MKKSVVMMIVALFAMSSFALAEGTTTAPGKTTVISKAKKGKKDKKDKKGKKAKKDAPAADAPAADAGAPAGGTQ